MGTQAPQQSHEDPKAAPSQYETAHVHDVYQAIAPHFSSTRHKPWPLVSTFLGSLSAGSVGLDVGCGNGKYLPVNPQIFIIASDRSANLVEIAEQQHGPHSVLVADILDLPHPLGFFDFAISIAVIHHLSTMERRVEAVRAVLDTLRPSSAEGAGGGRALFYVWALEQEGSRRGWGKSDVQDVMVPWVMKQDDNNPPGREGTRTFNRYYHLYKQGELESDIVKAGGTVAESGYERDNWWAIAVRTKL